MDGLITYPAKIFLGKGIDKKFPFLVDLYQRLHVSLVKEEIKKVKIPLGCQLLVSTKDTGVGLYLLNQGQFELQQTKLFLKKINKDDIVFDIGANVGYYTALASKLVGKSGRVYAFEPDKRNLELLKKNLELNHCKNVTIIPKAVVDKTGQIEFFQNLLSQGESSLTKTNFFQKEIVGSITLDDFVKEKEIKKINLVKIDIEGAEILALEGGKEFFKKAREVKLFLECNPNSLRNFGRSANDLVKTLENLSLSIRLIINEFSQQTNKFSKGNLEKTLNRVTYVNLYAEK